MPNKNKRYITKVCDNGRKDNLIQFSFLVVSQSKQYLRTVDGYMWDGKERLAISQTSTTLIRNRPCPVSETSKRNGGRRAVDENGTYTAALRVNSYLSHFPWYVSGPDVGPSCLPGSSARYKTVAVPLSMGTAVAEDSLLRAAFCRLYLCSPCARVLGSITDSLWYWALLMSMGTPLVTSCVARGASCQPVCFRAEFFPGELVIDDGVVVASKREALRVSQLLLFIREDSFHLLFIQFFF